MTSSKTPILSIIVPCWLSEKTICFCLSSIFESTFKDIEVIVVDSSPNMDTYAAVVPFLRAHKNLLYLRAPQKGTAKQCSFGVRRSKGKFIGFVDSDDFVHPKMFEILLENQRTYDADISSCRLQHASTYQLKAASDAGFRHASVNFYSGKKFLQLQACFPRFFANYSRCLHLVRKDVAIQRIHYYERLEENYWEDTIYDYGIILSASSAVTTDAPLYYYVHTSEHVDSRPIVNPVRHILYLLELQSIAEKMFLDAGKSKYIGQTFYPLIHDFIFLIHRPEILDSRQAFNSFIKPLKKKIRRPLWKMPTSQIVQAYEKKLIWAFRLGLYSLFYHKARRTIKKANGS